MKEPFVDVDTLIQQTKLLGDMELQAYLAGLGSAQKDTYVKSNILNAQNDALTNKANNFNNVFNQLSYADQNIVNANMYIQKVNRFTNLANQADNMANTQLNTASINNSVLGRQTEINEWANFNKLDTLYILQIIFIGLSVLGIFAFLMVNGFITEFLFRFLSYTIALIIVIVLLLRWRYTSVARDTRYWHKARFPTIATPVTASPQCPTT